MVDSFEKIPVKIFAGIKEGSLFAANEIATLIREKQEKNLVTCSVINRRLCMGA